jgi:hypothetical protein
MSQRLETRNVLLTATAPIELRPGLTMPAGTYPGLMQRTALSTHGGISWTAPQYKIAFSAEELSAMGAENLRSNLAGEGFTVTEFVRNGQIAVS